MTIFPALLCVPCMTAPLSAALVALPDIVVTEIGRQGNQSGVRLDTGLGKITAEDLPIGFFAGDEIVVTIRAADGMLFQFQGGSTFANLDLRYGSPLGTGVSIGTPMTSFAVHFGNLSGGSAPALDDMTRITVTPNGAARTGGLGYRSVTGGTFIPDTISFDSITLSGIAAASMDPRWVTDDRFPFSSVPTFFIFDMTDSASGGMSLVPIPEPSTFALFAGAAAFALTFSRRRP